ncbi:hypothetical protein, partial [Providencia sp. NPDC089930]|uniref:hypothetical protein n=1 Tax=Providencia sp. NPDC089930 TaxID=3414704 RepID=UPI003C2DC05E
PLESFPLFPRKQSRRLNVLTPEYSLNEITDQPTTALRYNLALPSNNVSRTALALSSLHVSLC